MKRLVLAITLASLAALAPCAEPSRARDGCPEIVVSGPPDAVVFDSDLTFRVTHAPQSLRANLTYKWTLSAGTIVGGQGTDAINTDLAGARGSTVEVTVEVGGLSGSCPGSVSYTLPPRIACYRPLDSYGDIEFEDEQARLDNYAIELQNDPTTAGHLVCYGGRRGRAGEAERRCVRAKKYLSEVRGVDASRLLVVGGGFREELTVEAWIVPAGWRPPQPSPTVDAGEVRFIKGKAMRRTRMKR